jgi:hypothetical protein
MRTSWRGVTGCGAVPGRALPKARLLVSGGGRHRLKMTTRSKPSSACAPITAWPTGHTSVVVVGYRLDSGVAAKMRLMLAKAVATYAESTL